jgi:hypothetical protein
LIDAHFSDLTHKKQCQKFISIFLSPFRRICIGHEFSHFSDLLPLGGFSIKTGRKVTKEELFMKKKDVIKSINSVFKLLQEEKKDAEVGEDDEDDAKVGY